MRRLGFTAGLGFALGCNASSVFICTGDADCNDGRCEPNGFCSFPSEQCDSGWVYGELSSPSLAGSCVGGAEDTSSPPTTTGVSAEDTSAEDSGTTTSGPEDTGEVSSDVTGTPTTTPTAETTYGTDTGPGPAPFYCEEHAYLLDLCYGPDYSRGFLEFCAYAYESYYEQGYYCGYAFAEFLACLSSLDCEQLPAASMFCAQAEQEFFDSCTTS